MLVWLTRFVEGGSTAHHTEARHARTAPHSIATPRSVTAYHFVYKTKCRNGHRCAIGPLVCDSFAARQPFLRERDAEAQQTHTLFHKTKWQDRPCNARAVEAQKLNTLFTRQSGATALAKRGHSNQASRVREPSKRNGKTLCLQNKVAHDRMTALSFEALF